MFHLKLDSHYSTKMGSSPFQAMKTADKTAAEPLWLNSAIKVYETNSWTKNQTSLKWKVRLKLEGVIQTTAVCARKGFVMSLMVFLEEKKKIQWRRLSTKVLEGGGRKLWSLTLSGHESTEIKEHESCSMARNAGKEWKGEGWPTVSSGEHGCRKNDSRRELMIDNRRGRMTERENNKHMGQILWWISKSRGKMGLIRQNKEDWTHGERRSENQK